MKVLLADDHRLLVEGLTNLLTAHGIEVVGAANDGLEALASTRALQPDLVLMDLKMPRCDGLAATRLIKAEMPEVKIIILTTSVEDQDLFDAVKSGAYGYLLKSMSGDGFIEALRSTEQDIPPFSPGLAAKILTEFTRQGTTHLKLPAVESESDLTARQREVLVLVAQGLSYKEVGTRLGLSARTIKYHIHEIIQHLHLKNRAQAVAYASRLNSGK